MTGFTVTHESMVMQTKLEKKTQQHPVVAVTRGWYNPSEASYVNGGVLTSLLKRRLQNKGAIHLYLLVVNFRPFQRPSLFTYYNSSEMANLLLYTATRHHVSHGTCQHP